MRLLLNFDGSAIGSFSYDDVVSSWWFPCAIKHTKTILSMYTFIKINGSRVPVILTPVPRLSVETALIDELKPLFRLVKNGTNRMRLDKVVRRQDPAKPWVTDGVPNTTTVDRSSMYVVIPSTPLVSLRNATIRPFLTSDVTDGHRTLYQDIQRLCVFLDIVGASSCLTENIMLRPHPLASDEFVAAFQRAIDAPTKPNPFDKRMTHDLSVLVGRCGPAWTGHDSEKRCGPAWTGHDRVIPASFGEVFRRRAKLPTRFTGYNAYCGKRLDTKPKALRSMLGTTGDLGVAQLRQGIERIVSRVDPKRISLAGDITSNVNDALTELQAGELI